MKFGYGNIAQRKAKTSYFDGDHVDVDYEPDAYTPDSTIHGPEFQAAMERVTQACEEDC